MASFAISLFASVAASNTIAAATVAVAGADTVVATLGAVPCCIIPILTAFALATVVAALASVADVTDACTSVV